MLEETGNGPKICKTPGTVEWIVAIDAVGVLSMLVASKSKIIDLVQISSRWASSSFEMDEHRRVGTEHHVAAKALLVLGLMAT